LNVKRVQFLQGASDLVALRGQPNFRQLGKRFGGRTQQAAQRIRELDDALLRRYRQGEKVTLELDGASYALQPGDVEVIEDAAGDLIVESDEGCTIALDPTLDDALQREGLARELVNRIQRLRKDAGLKVSDRIRLGIFGDGEVQEAVAQHGAYVAAETLATELVSGVVPDGNWLQTVQDVEIDGKTARIGVRRASDRS
jgi:isoleucyl-tRNA synthetase